MNTDNIKKAIELGMTHFLVRGDSVWLLVAPFGYNQSVKLTLEEFEVFLQVDCLPEDEKMERLGSIQ